MAASIDSYTKSVRGEVDYVELKKFTMKEKYGTCVPRIALFSRRLIIVDDRSKQDAVRF